MKKFDLIGSIFWVILGIGQCLGSVKLKLGTFHKPGPGFMPFLLGATMVVLGSTLLVSLVSKQGQEEGTWSGKKIWEKENLLKPALSFMAMVGYGLALERLGFLLTTFLFLFFLFKMATPRGWIIPLVSSGVTVMISHLIFAVWFNIPLPKGIFRF